MLGGDLRIFGTHFFKDSLPQASCVSHRVGFIAHQNIAPQRTVELGVLLAVLECVPDDALDPFSRVDVFLGSDLVGSSLLKHASCVRVDPFGILSENDEIDIFRLNAFQRAECGIEQADRAHVSVKVHFEAHAEQNFLGMNIGLHTWVAEGSDQNGIEVAGQHGESIRRNRRLVAQEAVGAPIEFGQIDGCSRGLDRVHSLRDNFFADAVAGYHGDAFSRLVF